MMYSAPFSLRASAPTRHANRRSWLRLQGSTPCCHDGQFNGQPNDPGKRPAIPGKEYLWCQGPSLKEKPKRETHQWGEGSDGRIIPVSRLLEKGPGSLTTPVHPSTPLPPPSPPQPQSPGWPASWHLDKGRGEGGGITWITAEGQLIERPLGR